MRDVVQPAAITSASRLPRLPSAARKLAFPLLGFVVGELALTLGGMEFKWSAYGVAAATIGLVVYLARDRPGLLTTFFILGMQADVYIRLLYGRAGTAGLEIPLSIIIGAILFVLLYFDRPIVYFGELKRPIIWILGTTAASIITSEERFAGVARLLFEIELVFIYTLGLNIVLRDRNLTRAVRLLAITLGIQGVIYVIQSKSGISFSLVGDVTELGSIPRPGGTVSANPAGFASYIMPILMILVARFVSTRPSKRQSIAESLVIILGILVVVMTYTRAAWAALVLGLACITVVGVARRYITLRQVVIIVVVMVLAAVAMIPMINARLEEAPLADSYNERANLNRMAILVIGAHPVFGVGAGAYQYAYKGYLTADLAAPDVWQYSVHNEYLMRTAETGLVGGLVFVWLMLRGLSHARRLSRSPDWQMRTFGLGWTAGILALSWQMYWVPWRGFAYNAVLWLLLGMTEGALMLERDKERPATVSAP